MGQRVGVGRPASGRQRGGLRAGSRCGETLAGAEVMAWHRDNNGDRIANAPLATDENGFFVLPANSRGYLLRARHGGRELGSQQEYSAYPYGRLPAHGQTIFFTDRALYRPGQTIQYKGICLRVDSEKVNYQVLGGQRVTVIFADPNGKEIARAEHRCNDYGSFNGSFTAPRDRLMGTMRIYVTEGPGGQANFN